MSRPKKLKDRVIMTVAVSKTQSDWVKHMALQMSKREGRMITVSEALRMAIETVYAVPKKQMEFGEKR